MTTRALPTVPETAPPDKFVRELPSPENCDADTVPEDVRLVRVPTDVMAAWAACVTTRALPTVPDTSEPVKFVRRLPSPIKLVAKTLVVIMEFDAYTSPP